MTELPGLVSVIVPAKDAAQYLARALDSVRAQTYRHLELIVVAGPSRDDTDRIARRYAPDQFLPQVSTGLWAAFNEGLAAACGEFVAFLGADDFWPADKLATQVAHAQAHPAAAAVYGLVHYFVEPGLELTPNLRQVVMGQPQPIRLLEAMLLRRLAFERVGRFDLRYRMGADTDWLARANDLGLHFALLPQVAVHKRFHADNYMLSDPQASQADLLRLLRESVSRKRAPNAGGSA